MNTKYLWLLIILLGFAACNTEEDFITTEAPEVLPELTAGSANFSNYVSVGNSLTAGFADGSLYAAVQNNSFPKLLSDKFALIGGGTFTQPTIDDNVGGLLLGGNIIPDLGPRLYFNTTSLSPETVSGTPTTEVSNNIYSTQGPFNNMGVPGAKVGHLVYDGYGNIANLLTSPATANPYFVRISSAPNATVLGDAVAQNPTFFSLWIGNNDVLGYALSGAESNTDSEDYDPITPLTGSLGIGFTETYSYIVGALASNGSKGVVANIPDVTSIPYFTTVPYNPIPLDAATAGFLNSASAYGAYNAGIIQAFAYLVSVNAISQENADTEIAKRTIIFSEGEGNAVVIIDEDLTDLTAVNPQLISIRQATEDDLIVLPASSFIGTEAVPGNSQTVNGVAIPLADKWVLTPEEQTEIADATTAFNAVIKNASTQLGLAFLDANALMNELANGGYSSGNFILTGDYATGGAFSLDGVHPNSRGYSLIANKIMKAIDDSYGSNFEESGNLYNIGDYPTNFPNGI